MDEGKKRKTMVFTIIAIAILLVAVGGATYAYFVASGYANRSSTVTVTTRAVDSISCTNAALSMTVNGSQMKTSSGTSAGVVAATSSGTLSCTATKGASDTSTDKCTLNVTYKPTNVFSHSASGAGKNELSLSVSAAASSGTLSNNTMSETDLSTYSSNSTTYNLINGLSWSFTANSVLTITYTTKMYNYNFDQSALAGKTYSGTMATTNMTCAYQ